MVNVIRNYRVPICIRYQVAGLGKVGVHEHNTKLSDGVAWLVKVLADDFRLKIVCTPQWSELASGGITIMD